MGQEIKSRKYPEFIPGYRISELVVIRLRRDYSIGKAKIFCDCICDCGKEYSSCIYNLVNSLKKYTRTSCGCGKGGAIFTPRIKHGLWKSSEYNTYQGIKQRCLNESCRIYKYYGGRGITICYRWREDFMAFYTDMGPKPSGEYSIERIDVNGNYEPSNCKWATIKEQSLNKRTSLKNRPMPSLV